MERFPGMDLQNARDKHGAPSPADVLPFIRMVASGLAHAHSKAIVHRDLKPTNLMTIRGDARVIDFGIARIIDPEGFRYTRSGGTPIGGQFAAPELEDDPRLEGPRIDVFGLGACWYWLLTGQVPIGRSWETALTKIEGVDERYAAVVFKTLEPLELRFRTMEELEREVHALETGESPTSLDDLVTNDDAVLVLGVIFEQESLDSGGGIAVYNLERQVAGHISKLRLRLALDVLFARGFVERQQTTQWNEDYMEFVVTPPGQAWVKEHKQRVEKLLKTIEAPSQEPADESDEDIPF